MVTYFMGVMFIALATAVILRTGALQLFARALWQGISGAASGTAAAAAVLLTPGLHCRLKESLQQGPLSACRRHRAPPPLEHLL